MTTTQNAGDRLLKVEETAEIIGSAVGTLNRARVIGGNFPSYVKIGKSVRYKMSTVLKWMEDQQEHQTTSAMDARR